MNQDNPPAPLPARTMTEVGDKAKKSAAEQEAREQLLTPGTVIHQYELIRELGRGGMGQVFLARDTRLARLVAIKFLLDHGGELTQLFLREARATARCKHDNIVIIYDVDEYRGHPYMVLEYIEGPTLRTWIEQRGYQDSSPSAHKPVPVGLAVELMVPVVRALTRAHEMGIVHRDLKPENILLSDAGPIKVLDFGVAKLIAGQDVPVPAEGEEAMAAGDRMTRSSTVMGTIPYMSPEQLRAGDGVVDHRTDIWAVGIILYELVTGHHPLAPLTRQIWFEVRDLDTDMPRVSEQHPDLGPLGHIIDRCLLKRKSDRTDSATTLLAELEALLPDRQDLSLSEDRNPFAGLASFQRGDARRFFGRDRDIAGAIARLRNQRLLAVVGPSGAGKSSFVRAGVIPALERSGEGWESLIIRPGRHPLAALASTLFTLSTKTTAPTLDLADIDMETLVHILRTQPGYLGAQLRARARQKVRRILVFVDQYEELYTLGAEPAERAAFAACLEGVADDASSPLRVMLTVRSDFLDRMADDRAFMHEVMHGLVFLSPMDRSGLREALTRPVDAAGYGFESRELVETMLDTLETTRSPLPLLQFTAAKLWEARDREQKRITQASHDALGGVAGALSTRADAVVSGLSTHEQNLARAVFLSLVTPERTRAVVDLNDLRAELLPLGKDKTVVEQVIDHLASERLVLIESGSEREGATVELVHESLIRNWPRLGRWLDENQEGAAFLARVRAAAKQWESSGHATGLLWRGRAAREARKWLHRYKRRLAEATGGVEPHRMLGEREERYLKAVVSLARRARLQAVATVTIIAALVALVTFAWTGRTAGGPACENLDQELAGVWDAAIKTRMRDAFLASGLAYAPDTFERVSAELDRHAQAWVATRTDTCEATHVQHKQPEDIMGLRVYCLDRRLSQMKAFIEIYTATLDAGMVTKAVQAAHDLPPVDYCSDITALTAAIPPPEDPVIRARVDALQPRVDRLDAHISAGKYSEGREQGEPLLVETADLDYAPLRARIMYAVASLRQRTGDPAGSEKLVRETVLMAARAKDDALVARAWSLLVFVLVLGQERYQDALDLKNTILAAVERTDDNWAKAAVLNSLAWAFNASGDYREAVRLYEWAVDIQKSTAEPDQVRLALSLHNLAVALQKLGEYDRARELYEQAIAVKVESLGPDHPDTALSLGNVATVLEKLGKYEKAREYYQRALDINEAIHGPQHDEVARTLGNLATVLKTLGDYEKARVYGERAVAIYKAISGPSTTKLARALNNLADIHAEMGEYAKARAASERARAMFESALGPDHDDVALALDTQAHVHEYLGEYKEARALYERAIHIKEKALGKDHSKVATSQAGLAEVLAATGNSDQAWTLSENAKRIYEEAFGADSAQLAYPLAVQAKILLARNEPAKALALLEPLLDITEPGQRARIQLLLAQALWESGGDRYRARDMATLAASKYFRIWHHDRLLAEAERWLTEHPAP